MDSRNIFFFFFFFFIIVTFLCFATIEAQEDTPVYYIDDACPTTTNVTTSNSPFQLNLMTLLSSLSSNATGDTQFYNTTVTGRDSSDSDSVYGLFMCRGDVTSQVCHYCVANATQRLLSDCSLSKQAVIWYSECMIRYSNSYFFSTVDTTPYVLMWNPSNVSNPVSFMRLMFSTMNETADEAANSPNKFATKEANVSGVQTLYCLAQCTPDLSLNNCRTCLSGAIGRLPRCCDGKQGGRAFYSSCNVRYELFPFYTTFHPSSPTPAPALVVPATSGSEADSNFSQVSVYLSNNCSSSNNNQTIITADSSFKRYLTILLSYLSSNATSGKGMKFHTATVNDMVYGLYMCRGDLPPRLCGQCVQNATHRITSKCHLQEAIIWYSHCMVRYSDQHFFYTVDISHMYKVINITNSSSSSTISDFYTSKVSNQLDRLAEDTGDSDERYKANALKLNHAQTLYSLGQCTQDLSSYDCTVCLKDVIVTAIPWSRLGSIGGRVLYPSCNLRFELFQFYRDTDQDLPPNGLQGTPSSPEKQNVRWRTIILIVVPTIILMLVFSSGYYLLRKKGRKNRRIILRENFGHESATLEPLQFDLVVIQAATNNFSDDNYLGKGGFGEVYKGILSDGRQIAVKRLSKSSMQGVEEFKNEVLLIAKLQHRNLVAFIGFCLEELEKMLIYEFVPNKSLDYFLFDSKRQKSLGWVERYNIIGGIARGILYLHEHSRLKVIHRDLKPSNILLDENMIPKISDFGLARIVEISHDQGSTNRIVGTYGYMSPEYAMLGQFSEKSDVFSFGVMILEIVSGKKNLSSYGHRGTDGLLNYVWRQWRDQTPLSILDPNIKDDYSKVEVLKCIQIGLLCVQHNPDARPTMVTVVSYLSSYSIELPTPQEPGFFWHGRMDSNAAQESSSTQSASSSTLFSISEMPSSVFLPR